VEKNDALLIHYIHKQQPKVNRDWVGKIDKPQISKVFQLESLDSQEGSCCWSEQ
jgi:hypothetical protein